MAISLTIKKFNNREYAYIVDNYRDPSTKRPTSRTHESYGRLDKLLAADPDALKKREARKSAPGGFKSLCRRRKRTVAEGRYCYA